MSGGSTVLSRLYRVRFEIKGARLTTEFNWVLKGDRTQGKVREGRRWRDRIVGSGGETMGA